MHTITVHRGVVDIPVKLPVTLTCGSKTNTLMHSSVPLKRTSMRLSRRPIQRMMSTNKIKSEKFLFLEDVEYV